MVTKPIFLIGMMGSGKSTIGKAMARALNTPFYDTDELIAEQEGRSIHQIFEQDGERYFRALEQDVLAKLPNSPCVVACGGGMPCFEGNMLLLKQKGWVVYLEVAVDLLYERIKQDTSRPLLKDWTSFKSLFQQRVGVYKSADLTIDAHLEIWELVQMLQQTLNINKDLS
jgi:shikimate kinase